MPKVGSSMEAIYIYSDILISSLILPLVIMVIGTAMMITHPKLGYSLAYLGGVIEFIAFGIGLIYLILW